MDVLKTLAKQPYWVIALVLGVGLIALPCVDVEKEHWKTHPPTTPVPIVIGIVLLSVSIAAFGISLWMKLKPSTDFGGGLDLSPVKDENDVLWTTVAGCEIRVVKGRIEDYGRQSGITVVLPCNEYFDDQCANDPKSALGAYVLGVFEGEADQLISLMHAECKKRLGSGVEQQKTEDERAESFGAGECLLLLKPLGRSVDVAFISTTTQRAGEGLSARVSYLFDGMRELVRRLADHRIDEVAMPLLGAGHGRITKPLAFVALLLAIAEAVRHVPGGRQLKRVTIVVFQKQRDAKPEIDPIIIRRALALIGAQN